MAQNRDSKGRFAKKIPLIQDKLWISNEELLAEIERREKDFYEQYPEFTLKNLKEEFYRRGLDGKKVSTDPVLDAIQEDVEHGLSDVYLGIPGIYSDPVAYTTAYRDGFGKIELDGHTYTRVDSAVQDAINRVSDPNDVMFGAEIIVIPVKVMPKVMAVVTPKTVTETKVEVQYPK